MPLCGSCGYSDQKTEPDEDGNCGNCHEDLWLEWNDFTIPNLRNYIKKAASKLNLSIPELALKIYKAEYFNSKNRDTIKKIFQKFI